MAIRFTSLVLLLSCTAACSAITSPGRFEFDDEPMLAECPEVSADDLGLEFRNFEGFQTEKIEFRVVEVGSSELVVRGRLDEIDPDGYADTDNSTLLCLSLPGVVMANGPLLVRTYVDVDEDFDYLVGEEPAWEDMVIDGTAVIDGSEMSVSVDEQINPPGSFTLSLTGMRPHADPPQHFALIVVDMEDMEPVGYFRKARAEPEFEVSLFDTLEPDKDYLVELYADFSRNGAFDPQPTDHTWARTYRSDGEGNIDESFAHDPIFDDVMFF